MPHFLSPESRLPVIGKLRRHLRSRESRSERPHTMSICFPISACTTSCVSQLQRISKPPNTTIHDLDDDSLLHMFNLLRPSLLLYGGDEPGSFWEWDGQRWWYKLVHVCRRWRRLILGSASYLRLCLVCTPGTPVADMLAHSPPLPLVIGYKHPDHGLTADDEEGIMLALRHCNRVRFIFIDVAVSSLKKILPAVDDDFPTLEYLRIAASAKHNSHFTLPPTVEAPHLRDLWLSHFASPIGSPLLSTAIGLVRLKLDWIHPSTYPHPNDFLRQLSLLPQLEEMAFTFRSPVPARDIERELLHTPVTDYVTLPNLRIFDFVGVSGFLEAVLPHMTTPLLETLYIRFFNQLSFSVPHLSHFMMTAEKFRLSHAELMFHRDAVSLYAFPRETRSYTGFLLMVPCPHLDWQVSSVAQILHFLNPLLSEVVGLTLIYREHTLSLESHSQADRRRWRELLAPFRNVTKLRVHNGLVGHVSHSLRLDGEPPLEVLPELKELICPKRSVDDKAFAPFIREREVSGQPVNLIGEAFPVGRIRYWFRNSTGKTYIEPDQDPPP